MPKKKKGNDTIDLRELGDGLVRFMEVVFKFILDLLKIGLAVLKAILWVMLLAAVTLLVAALSFYLFMTAFGFKDSPSFQMYREALVEEMFEEMREEIEEEMEVEMGEDVFIDEVNLNVAF